MEDTEYATFFETTPQPTSYANTESKIKCFIDRHSEEKRSIVLVTVRHDANEIYRHTAYQFQSLLVAIE
jgi:hypothetical protein